MKIVSMFLMMVSMANFAFGSSNNCANFNGQWTLKQGSEFPRMPEVMIENCKTFSRNESGYWNTFEIDGDASFHNAYGNDKFLQTVRGSWNTDKTMLTIEVFDKVEKGFNPAFGEGKGKYRIMTWKLSENNPDILISKEYTQEFSRTTGKVKQNMDVEIYYRNLP